MATQTSKSVDGTAASVFSGQHLASSSHPGSNIAAPVISSDYTRTVATTVNIERPLPNAVFTLPAHVITAIIGRAALSKETRQQLPATCRKFYLAHQEYENGISSFVLGKTTIELYCGRLYTTPIPLPTEPDPAHLDEGEVGDEPRLIRIPPVDQVWPGSGCLFAKTAWGVYAWGDSRHRLGTQCSQTACKGPMRVLIDGEVLDIHSTKNRTFFRTSGGWLGVGDNKHRQLGVLDETNGGRPGHVVNSCNITHWSCGDHFTIGWTCGGLLACGANKDGQCGVGSTERFITTLTPVALPADIKGRVDWVVIGGPRVMVLSGRRCFVFGSNFHGAIGLGRQACSCTPVELPIPVDDIMFLSHAIIVSDGRLLACGPNNRRALPVNADQVLTPTALDLPGPVVRIVSFPAGLFVQMENGQWAGRGYYNRDWFISVANAHVLMISDDDDEYELDIMIPVTRYWTQVNPTFAAELSALPQGGDVMALPTPAAATEYGHVVHLLADGEALETVDAGHGVTMVRTAAGWVKRRGMDTVVPVPDGKVPGTFMPTRWSAVGYNTFVWDGEDLLVHGDNRNGQCGVGSTERFITTLTPVALPADIKGRVDWVVDADDLTFFIAGRRCFACGFNLYGQLGLGPEATAINTPIELPVPVDDVITDSVTVIRSGDTLLAERV